VRHGTIHQSAATQPFTDIPDPVRAELEEEGEALVRYVEADFEEFAIEWA